MILTPLLGSESRERVLQYVLAKDEGYAREIARFYECDLNSVQKQLDRLEKGGIFISKQSGKTVIYSFNPKYMFLKELQNILLKARECYPPELIESLTMDRKRPRRNGKPL
jgi:DNA-binding MarR family transcriptional regulator